MLGAIIGDIVGSRFEWDNHKDKHFELFTEDCRMTADSIMTLAVAKALLETEKAMESVAEGQERKSDYFSLLKKMSIQYMQAFGRRYPDCGFSRAFYQWIVSEEPQPYNSYGNGAAMRAVTVLPEARRLVLFGPPATPEPARLADASGSPAESLPH